MFIFDGLIETSLVAKHYMISSMTYVKGRTAKETSQLQWRSRWSINQNVCGEWSSSYFFSVLPSELSLCCSEHRTMHQFVLPDAIRPVYWQELFFSQMKRSLPVKTAAINFMEASGPQHCLHTYLKPACGENALHKFFWLPIDFTGRSVALVLHAALEDPRIPSCRDPRSAYNCVVEAAPNCFSWLSSM